MSFNELKAYLKTQIEPEPNSHISRAQSALQMIENVDLMIDQYFQQNNKEKGAILLAVFGLLQGFFVGIDALYDLAIGLTRYKYHININKNPILHELKYIRNDIVGHPTHRTYPKGGTGFSLFKTDEIKLDQITYKTYLYEKNKVEIKERTIVFQTLMKHYQKEKNNIIHDLYQYVQVDTLTTTIPEQLFTLFETLNRSLLKKIVAEFTNKYQLSPNSNHRFCWRARLLEKLIDWDSSNLELQSLILYMAKVQVTKMYDIALGLEKRQGVDLYPSLPPLLQRFYKFIRKHEKQALHYLTYLHDYNHPLRRSDLQALIDLNPDEGIKTILKSMLEETDEDKVYLIGSTFKNYRPKNTK
ncbi:MAG: hypothetical protein WC225_02140 [Acholeplasmataceae bacterium]